MTENRLATARSPYLRQHRTNPVDWYPWGDEAFERARAEEKPVFLSVGYAACHWCHVMSHESFEDEATAALLDETFVCVKVDREERPDVDALYMQAVHVMSGRGGWPMTVLLTPRGDPFFAATYLPRDRLQALTRSVAEAWGSQREAIEGQAASVAERLRSAADRDDLPEFGGDDADLLRLVESALGSSFDRRHGGYGQRPKFPPHAELLLLLDLVERGTGDEGLPQVVQTLERMAAGGVHDQIGGGFHRYSTDAEWFLPHFEKMLYDNALLAQILARAWEATGEGAFRDTARGILGWARREMACPDGGYASSLDADTEGEEGLTYTWTLDELRAVLGDADGDLAARVHGVTEEGNFQDEATGRRTGRSILHLPRPLAEVGALADSPPADFRGRLEGIHGRLLEARDRRPQPGLDDKVITAWNGLFLSALAHCGRVFEESGTLEDGRRLATFLLDACRRDDGTLLRFPRGAEAEIVGFCEDHAHLGEGLLDLAEATGEVCWQEAAADVADRMLDLFEDAAGGFFSTSLTHHERLLARQKETFDSPIPSENGAATRLLLRLAAVTGDARYRAAADRSLAAWRPLLGWARSARGTVALHRALALGAALDAASEGGPEDTEPDATASSDVVRAELFLAQGGLEPGREAAFAIRVTVDDGWSVGGGEGAPATLDTPAEASVELVMVEPVAVLEGVSWIRGTLRLATDAPPGDPVVRLELDVQPCGEGSCLAPRTLVLEAPVRGEDREA